MAGAPLLEALVLWACLSGNHCDEIYKAYYTQSPDLQNLMKNAETYGNRLQREYVPESLVIGMTPIVYAIQGQATINMGGENRLIINLKTPALGYRWSF